MSRVRWGNVAQLAALAVAVALIAFGMPAGCGSEPEVIPLDALPGEPVETAAPMPAPRPPRVRQRRAAPHPPRARRRRAPHPRPAAPPVSVAGRRLPPRAPIAPLVPEAAREFSFDR